MHQNAILNTDSYKLSHFLQYPKNTKFVSAYIESRGGRWNRLLFFGLQIFLMEYLKKPISQTDILEAKEFSFKHGLPFNEAGWRHILEAHNGVLPLKIEAVSEGAIVSTDNVLLQVVNTDPAVPWLTLHIETALLRAIWYPVAVATNSYYCKQNILHYLKESGSPENIGFMLHDFGARGVSSFESAGIGGAAHLVNFKGSDTISGALFAKKYYGADMAALSIPASEHSVLTAWGKGGEFAAYENMAKNFSKETFACVIDSYDTFNAIEMWGKLFNSVATAGGRVVLRPDSGNPVTMAAECIERIMNIAGFSINDKGYRILPPHIRLIYGDGVNPQSIEDILTELTLRRISSDNILFGMGGALLQHLNRDTLKFAMKASAISEDGIDWIGVQKDPMTDPSKRSKSGLLALIKESGVYKTVNKNELNGRQNELKPVFENGKILREFSFDEIRKNSCES